MPRLTTVPAELTFAVADPRVVALTSFGPLPLRAELRDASGSVLARAAGRTDDWNIAVSRRLAAGDIHLVLTPLVPPRGAHSADAGGDSNDTSQTGDQGGGDHQGSDDSMADASSDQAQSPDQGAQSAEQSDADKDQSGSDQSDQQPAPSAPTRTEITLSLPTRSAGGGPAGQRGHGPHRWRRAARDTAEPAIGQPAGRGRGSPGRDHPRARAAWHRWTMAPDWPEPGAGARHRRAGPGRHPGWRISAWTVDGGSAPIRFASRAVTAAARVVVGTAPIGTVPLEPVALDGITRHWNAASVADPDRLALRADGSNPPLMAASVPGQPAEAPANGMIAAQSDRVWLLSSDATAPHLAVVGIGPDAALPLAVPAGGKVSLPAGSGPCAFVARSGLGQPGLEAGQGMGTAPGSAFALCGDAILSAWECATPRRSGSACNASH